jgi:hypothetical protein
VRRYGVKQQTPSRDGVDQAIESLGLLGFAVVDGGYAAAELDGFAEHFDRAHAALIARHGLEALREIDEHNTIRAPLTIDPLFATLAMNPVIIAICKRIFGDAFVLNQQNGVINPANQNDYNQGAWHRDLAYQHFVSSRPLAINALFCIDEFTAENGATAVVPGSHKQEAFPSDATVRHLERAIAAPRGAFIVMDGMTFHTGSPNRSDRPRRGVNHVYSLPFIKQQIDLSSVFALNRDEHTPADVAGYYESRRRKLASRAKD